MSLKEWILKKIIEREGTKMLDKIRNAVSGYKTYGLAALGILNLVIGHYAGPTHIGPIDIPAVDNADMWSGIWACLVIISGRAGIAKTVAPGK